MLSTSGISRCLAHLAAASAAEFVELTGGGHDDAPSLWIDDTAEAKAAHAAHIRSAEYRELHRPAATNAAMGLFGGEPGFEKSYRVWVDPDRPQMKHVYNQTALAKNLRYARYGYFKRDMRLLDVDKLVRHARLLPTPTRLLTDFIYQRVPLPDRSCAGFLRYQLDQLTMLDEWSRDASLSVAEEMFERMAVTNIPPVDVGVETHAEMIRCCAVCGAWEKGWDIYLRRAREVEEEEAQAAGDDGESNFVMDSYIFDAAMELCVACERPEEGRAILEEVIHRHLRPRPEMLEKAMILAAIATAEASSSSSSGVAKEAEEAGAEAAISRRERFTQFGLDAWALYDFYALPRSTASFAAYLRLCGCLAQPTLALEALGLADAAGTPLSLQCYHWALYSLRGVAAFGDFVMDVFGQLSPRGLSPDYVLFTVAFAYAARHADGALACALYDQHLLRLDINPTPEMALLFVQACADSPAPAADMLARCDAMIERLESVGSAVDRIEAIYDKYMELAAHLGAVASAFSRIKKLVSFGKPLSTRQMNSLLFANANAAAPNGGAAMTAEIASIFQLLQVEPNADTVKGLAFCVEAHGATEEVQQWANVLAALQEERGDGLVDDAAIPVECDPPNKIRQLRTNWHIRPRDTMLKRFGQTSKLRPTPDVGGLVGSMVPFGKAPGERMV